MRALLLAAGRGTRLRPMTDTVPKCLVLVHGRPLLDYWLELLFDAGIERVAACPRGELVIRERSLDDVPGREYLSGDPLCRVRDHRDRIKIDHRAGIQQPRHL